MGIENQILSEEQTSSKKNEVNNTEKKEKIINHENLKAYVEGCEKIAGTLYTVINEVKDNGKRPVILIPSRGAIPIFLLSKRVLDFTYETQSPLSNNNANYYPVGILEYIDGKPPNSNSIQATTDIILYPFTADVTLEGRSSDQLAKKIRQSAVNAVLQLTTPTKAEGYDLDWYKFIMRKVNNNTREEALLQSNNILQSLESYQKQEDTQIIIIDTVISGRAADNITEAFSKAGHKVVPILAVDSIDPGKFKNERKSHIQSNTEWRFAPKDAESIFTSFPLLTEDKGAALLGLVALNFSNFNKEGLFNSVNPQFPADFLPQSCIWTLPPISTRAVYLENFKQFLDITWRVHENQAKESEIYELQEKSRELTRRYRNQLPLSEINEIIALPKATVVKETSSHIISVTLPQDEEKKWIESFAQHINKGRKHNTRDLANK